jgi:hypothetical protein
MEKELKNYEKLKKELTEKFGRIYWFNDKRKSYERRIKIYGIYDKFKFDMMFNFLEDKGYNVKEWNNNKSSWRFKNHTCLVVYFGK